MGMLYKRGEIYWIKYYVGGKPTWKITGTPKQKETERFLKDQEGHVAMGEPILPRVARVRVEELPADLLAHYQTSGRRRLHEAEIRFTPLKAFYTGRRVTAISGDVLIAYIQHRHAAGLSNGTVNR